MHTQSLLTTFRVPCLLPLSCAAAAGFFQLVLLPKHNQPGLLLHSHQRGEPDHRVGPLHMMRLPRVLAWNPHVLLLLAAFLVLACSLTGLLLMLAGWLLRCAGCG
jgi:hypothetical protein